MGSGSPISLDLLKTPISILTSTGVPSSIRAFISPTLPAGLTKSLLLSVPLSLISSFLNSSSSGKPSGGPTITKGCLSCTKFLYSSCWGRGHKAWFLYQSAHTASPQTAYRIRESKFHQAPAWKGKRHWTGLCWQESR